MKNLNEKIAEKFPLLPTLEICGRRKGKQFKIPLESLLGVWKIRDCFGVIGDKRKIYCTRKGKQFVFPFSEFKNKSRLSYFASLFNSQLNISSLVFGLREIQLIEKEKLRTKQLHSLLHSFCNMPISGKRGIEVSEETREALKELRKDYLELKKDFDLREILFSQIPFHIIHNW